LYTWNSNNVNNYIRWNFKLVLKTFLLCFLAFFIFYLIIVLLHIFNFKSVHTHHYFVYSLWLAPFSALYILLASFILSYKQNKLALFFNKIALNILLILFLFTTVYFLRFSVQFYHIILFLFLAFCLIIIVEFVLVSRILLKHDVHITQKVINIEPKIRKESLTDSWNELCCFNSRSC